MGLETPYVENPEDPPPPNEFPFFAVNQLDPTYVNGQRVTMTVDGLAVSFAVGTMLQNMGAAVPCPSPGQGPLCSVGVRYNGVNTVAFWRVYNDGYAGFVPGNAGYLGRGQISPVGTVARGGGEARRHRSKQIEPNR